MAHADVADGVEHALVNQARRPTRTSISAGSTGPADAAGV